MGNQGFVGPSSLLYHLHPPTEVRAVRLLKDARRGVETSGHPGLRHFRTSRLPESASAVLDRIPLVHNADVALLFARVGSGEDHFYRNGQGDEVVYVSEGEGRLETQFGTLAFGSGDYLVIPRGIVHRYAIQSSSASLLIIESYGYVRTPKRYRGEHGQLIEGSPYSERDLRTPDEVPPHDEKGDFTLVIRKGQALYEATLTHHPFDVAGWDGYYFPWAFQIRNFEPRVGRFHLPPPVHQTFEGSGFVICSFCPRPYDFDPEAVPAPYNHSNVMSDEVIFYASPEFMSRKGIEYGSITLHPDGFPHGPHPGKAEESIGQKETNELAVMLDTFRPLQVTGEAAAVEDAGYYLSWLAADSS
jgi:homogentisate 1,2-dioxygenase